MAYEDFAFVEHIKEINNLKNAEFAIVMPITRQDLQELKAMTKKELTKNPTQAMVSANKMSGELLGEEKIGPGKSSKRFIFDAKISLPAAFAATAYAAKMGREVKIAVTRKPWQEKGMTGGHLAQDFISHYENDVLAGAQSFFEYAFHSMGRPQKLYFYSFIKTKTFS